MLRSLRILEKQMKPSVLKNSLIDVVEDVEGGMTLSEAMGKHLGQSVIVENVAGAGGATGSLRGKNAKPDGYTIGFGHMGTHAASVSTTTKLPYDPTADYDYLGIHLVTPHVMITRKDFPANATMAAAKW